MLEFSPLPNPWWGDGAPSYLYLFIFLASPLLIVLRWNGVECLLLQRNGFLKKHEHSLLI